MRQDSLFESLRWVDPYTGQCLVPVVTARTPCGGPLSGALQVAGTRLGYPIVDGVARLTHESALAHRDWLTAVGLEPPVPREGIFQPEASVESFGFQWAWNSAMRTEDDLRWRTAARFRLDPAGFRGSLVLDAGAGAGDQSRWLLDQAAEVVSVDLSSAIDVVARKLRLRPGWVGVQGDITALPFADEQFGHVYCEGVIQHTRDSALAVRELCRVARPGGLVLATHYGEAARLLGRVRLALIKSMRGRLCRLERFRLLWLTGNLAALAHVPLVGRLVRLSGVASYSTLMPDFRTTWTNTFDSFGNHAHQRHISPAEFLGYFDAAGRMTVTHQERTLVVARKTGGVPDSQATRLDRRRGTAPAGERRVSGGGAPRCGC